MDTFPSLCLCSK